MTWIREGWQRLRSLVRQDALETRLDEEIRFHIDQQVDKHARAGLTPDEARRRALVRFGGVERIKEHTRDEFRPVLLQDSLQDLRIGIRALRRAPAFTLVAVLTLALGIGATTAVFTVVYNVLIRPLPFPDAGRLVSLKHTSRDIKAGPPVGMSATLLLTYTHENRSFEHLGVWARDTANVTDGVLPEEVTTLNVSVGALPALGVQPALGRWFSGEDHTLAAPETVILIHGYWQRRFGGERSIIGRRVLIDGRPRTVVGVMPASFRFLNETPDVILPARFEPAMLTLGGFNYEGIARLAPGVTLEQARADVARMIPIWINAWPSFPGIDRSAFAESGMAPVIKPLKQELVGNVRDMLWLLMSTIAIVLLIACANVANLVLVRAESRHHELAIRTALGAGRRRLARAMLLESLVLGLVSGVCGLPLAWSGLHLLRIMGPSKLPRLNEISLDPLLVIFTLLISVTAALFLGIMPVVKHTEQMPLALRASGRTTSDSLERQRTRHMLVVLQVALALILLIGSGLMIRTFLALRAVPPGFIDPDHVQLVRVTIPEALARDPEQVFRLQRAMRERIAAIPQVADVSFTGLVPLANERSRSTIAREDSNDIDSGAPPVMRWFRYVAPGFFQTIGTPVVAGRDFTWTDLDEHRPVVVISENLARELWRHPEGALGRRIREGTASPWREIVGVVGDVHENGLHEPAPTIVYWPSLMPAFNGQLPYVRRAVTFTIRSARAGNESLLAQVREAIQAVNADVPLTRVRTLGNVYDGTLATTTFTLVMLALAAGIALFLGIVGIYGVIAYAVTHRRREIGIRIALGAAHRDVKLMFVRQGMLLGAIGVAIGIAGAALVTRLMATLLFGTSPLDPMTFALVSAGLVAVAGLASYLPAHAATGVDPVRTLRGE
jgi:putative ABC transport system permease protein